MEFQLADNNHSNDVQLINDESLVEHHQNKLDEMNSFLVEDSLVAGNNVDLDSNEKEYFYSDEISTKELNHKEINDVETRIDEAVSENSELSHQSEVIENKCHLQNDSKEELLNNDKVHSQNDFAEKKISNLETDGEFTDILGNGLLTKRIIERGLGRETRPTHGDSVKINYKCWNSANELVESDETTFVLGDGDMIQAFDLGICLAEQQEEFELKTDSRFAYGSIGLPPKIQPMESLTYRIKLLAVDDPPDYSVMLYEERMEAVNKKRERGNYLYRREEYSLAVNSYSKAIKIIETDPDYKKISSDVNKVDLLDLFIKVTNNLAASQLKLESYDSVIETCNIILSYDPINVKALFRKGKSLSSKGNYADAINVLKQAQELENSKLIVNEIQKCYQLKKNEDEQRARICRRMFANNNLKDDLSKSSNKTSKRFDWRQIIMKYSPYVGAVVVTGISVILATMAINKSKGN